MFRFEYPFVLLLLIFIPVSFYLMVKGRQGIIYPSLEHSMDAIKTKTLRVRLIVLPEILFSLGLALAVLALCRPVHYDSNSKETRKGIILEMVLDRSGSMGTWMDKEQNRNRLDIVKETFLKFIDQRENDVIGLITFARYADTLTPLTGSHGIFRAFVDSIALADQDEDGTAIGEALALGVARIESYRSGLDSGAQPDAVIILLTDGQNNQGKITPQEAAGLAAEKGITVYTIGFGGGFYRNAFGFWDKIPPAYGIDENLLTMIAEKTAGLYFNAEDEKSLQEIYRKIDALEKVELDTAAYIRKEELFQKFLFLSLLLIIVSLVLKDLFFNVVDETT